MAENLSEEAIRKNCPHCDLNSFAMRYPLGNTKNFWILSDANSLCEGHILIIPKQHLSCVGEFDEVILKEFEDIYNKVKNFVLINYGAVSTFEHGKIGQTVFHSHVHILPYGGNWETIIPEGAGYVTPINSIRELTDKFTSDNGYLFFSIGDNMYCVDPKIVTPRFFRDRFALALNRPERGNWKVMRENSKLMEQALKDINGSQEKWKENSIV